MRWKEGKGEGRGMPTLFIIKGDAMKGERYHDEWMDDLSSIGIELGTHNGRKYQFYTELHVLV